MTQFRNTEQAFLSLLRTIADVGEEISVRGSVTREITSQQIEITNPRERVVVIPGRNNNVFASIAESLWVLAGRDDVAYLEGYLKRAGDYSDDGLTWRGAYGPRLRNWYGTDQLQQILTILRDEPASRRAVATLYDPARDFVDTKDVPCNNWLHFLRRNGQLHLHVAARSTDIWWGFSGINIFEWALLLEMMANWLGDEPGHLTFTTSSLHLYEQHYPKAITVLDQEPHTATYPDSDERRVPRFTTPWAQFDDVLDSWFRLEDQLRTGADLVTLEVPFDDPLLRQYIAMIDIYWAFKRGTPQQDLDFRIAALGHTDLARAAKEFVNRPNSHSH